jgi:hypothetical protein
MRSQLLLALLTCSVFFPTQAMAQAPKPAAAAEKPKADKPAEKKPGDPKAAGTEAAAAAGVTATPAAADLPPPPPPPWSATQPPATSTAGTQLMPATPTAAPATAGATSTVPATDAAQEKITIDNRFQMLEARIAADEKAEKEDNEAMAWLRRFKVSGFVQPQLLWQGFNEKGSPNLNAQGALPAGIGSNTTIAKTDPNNATTTNGDFFRLRRARLKLEYMPTDYARFVMEIDPIPGGGPGAGIGTIARNVEAVGIAKWAPTVTTEFGMGIFKIPFGREILQSDADRPFIERSWGEQNMVPGEFDTGARAYTTVKVAHGGIGADGTLVVQLAVVNGATLGEKNFVALPDLNKGKDFVGRINYDFGDWLDLGVSGYYGQGQAVDGTALKFKQFPRWGFNAEVGLHHEWSKKLGKTKVYSELTIAENLDRGTKYGFALPAIPADVTQDVTSIDQRNVWVRVEQDVTEWVTLGARYDVYTPDTSIANNAKDTFGVVAAVHFTKGLQWMIEYDHAIDNVHKASGTAPSKTIDVLSNVLQARF